MHTLRSLLPVEWAGAPSSGCGLSCRLVRSLGRARRDTVTSEKRVLSSGHNGFISAVITRKHNLIFCINLYNCVGLPIDDRKRKIVAPLLHNNVPR